MINERALRALVVNADTRIGKDGETVVEAIASIVKLYSVGRVIDGKADQVTEEINYFHVYSAYNRAEMTEEEKEEKIRYLLSQADKKYIAGGKKLVWLSSKCREITGEYLLKEKLDRDSAPDCLRALKALVETLSDFGYLRRA